MESRNTSDLILHAALALFSEKGFSATTTREIAQKAGCAEGTIFRYFPTKKDILISLVRPHALEELRRVMDNLPRQGEEENLRLILENRLKTIMKNKSLIKVVLTEAQYHDELKDYLMENIASHVFDTLAAYLAERMEAGVFRKADPYIFARILVGMMASLLLSESFYPMEGFDEKKRGDYLNEIMNIFLHGVLKKED
jgi:AcrR family transcriptional regulator